MNNPYEAEATRLAGRAGHPGSLALVEALLAVAWEVAELRAMLEARDEAHALAAREAVQR